MPEETNGQPAAFSIPKGFQASGVKAGIKPSGGLDLAVLACDSRCGAAGVFTLNRVAAAPVQWCRAIVPGGSIRAVVVNAGNANAATGAEGFANARAMAERAAARVGCAPEDVLVASTGVIGRQLPMDAVLPGIDGAFGSATEEMAGFEDASRAILTTDTRPKVVSRRLELSTGPITILGIAKGAAMIGPNMATMLAFFLTDARVSPGALQGILNATVDDTFNCISVEGHTSTNDCVLALSRAAPDVIPLHGADLSAFAAGFRSAAEELAVMIPADGEGATHLITVEVSGCKDASEARAIAKAVADSPLVKTAIHGADPNWGRIVSAAGYAGVPFDESEVSLHLNDILLYEDGVPVPFDGAAASESLRALRDISVRLSLKRGDASARFWTCDLTAEYVRLNADYTT